MRHGTAAGLLACLALAAALLASPARTQPLPSPPPPASDFTTFQDPLTKLAASLTVGTTGKPVGRRQGSSDPSMTSYQKFALGTVHFNPNWGATFIYPKPVADLWEANKNVLGAPEKNSLPFPKPGSNEQTCAKRKGLQGTVTYFAGGGIVFMASTGAVLLTGPTYVKFLQMQDVFGDMGPPQPSRLYKGTGAKGTGFACGWIVEAVGSTPYKPAYALLESSPIAKAHQGISLAKAAAFTVGDPVGDEDVVKFGTTQQRFTAGIMLYSSQTGVQVVMAGLPAVANRPTLLEEYESTYGGPKGVLGLPTAGNAIQTVTVKGPSGQLVTLYTLDCEKGVLVWYPSGGSSLPWGTTQAFTKLAVYIENLKTYGCDTIFCSDQDPYFSISMSATGQGSKAVKIPTSGYYQDKPVVSVKSDKGLVVSKVSASTVISLSFNARDDDTGPDDNLGTVTNSLTVATGWGAFDGLFDKRVSDFRPEYSIKRSSDVTSLLLKPQWRYNYQWPFKNFKTALLSEDQMADTFTDIGRDEFVLAHPFHALFYTYVYKELAKTGNCFGMALSETMAQVGRSPFSPPLGLLGSNSARNGGCICMDCSKSCGPSNLATANRNIVRHINEYHGYQLNAVVGCKGLELYKEMLKANFQVLNGHTVFADAEKRHKAGDPQLISMSADMTGHVLRAYAFARNKADPGCANLGAGTATCHIMTIADPNHPYTTNDNAEVADPNRWKLVVHPSNGKWYYDSKYNNLPSKTTPKRYALMNIPLSWVYKKGPSIVDDIPWGTLWDIGMLMIFGDADIDTVADSTGQPLGSASSHVTAYPAPSDFAVIPGTILPKQPRLYAVRRHNGAAQQPLRIRVKPRGNYTLALKTRDGSFELEAPKGDGSVDELVVGGFDTGPASQAFTVTPGSVKSIVLRLTAPTRASSSGPPLTYMLSKLNVAKAQKIDAALLDAGRALKVGSQVSQLKYDLRISRGVDALGLRGSRLYSNLTPGSSQLLVPKLLPAFQIGGGKKKSRRRSA